MEYLMRGGNEITPESRSVFEKRAGITGFSGGVIVSKTLADNIEIVLKVYGGMFEPGTLYDNESDNIVGRSVSELSLTAEKFLLPWRITPYDDV